MRQLNVVKDGNGALFRVVAFTARDYYSGEVGRGGEELNEALSIIRSYPKSKLRIGTYENMT